MNPHKQPNLDEFRAWTDIQLRFNDIDILGHVNNTVYFSFYDTGKARYLEAVRESRIDWRKVESVIVNIDCAFIHPTFFGEEIRVYTRCESLSDKSFRLMQVIADKNTKQIKSMCETVMVCFNPETGESMEIPDSLRRDFCRFEGRDLGKKD